MNKYNYLISVFLYSLAVTVHAANSDLTTGTNNANSAYSAFANNISGLSAYALSSDNAYKRGIYACIPSSPDITTYLNPAINQIIASINTTPYTSTQLANLINSINALISSANQLNSVAQCINNAANNMSLKPSSEAHRGDPRPSAAALVTQAQSFATAVQQLLNTATVLYNNSTASSADQAQLVTLLTGIVPNLNVINNLINNSIQHSSQFTDLANFQTNSLVQTAQSIWKQYATGNSLPMSGFTVATVNNLQNSARNYLDSAVNSLNNSVAPLTTAINDTTCYYCLAGTSASYTSNALSDIKGLVQEILQALTNYKNYYSLS